MENCIISLMLVEDQKLLRVGIKSLFEENNEINIVAEAENGREAIDKAIRYKPNVIMLDISLPDMSGLSVLKALNNKECNSKTIILTSHNSADEVIKALSLGVYAYVLKDVNTDRLMNIVKTVYDGAMWLDPKIVPVLREKSDKIIPQKQTSRAMFRNSHSNLTQREYEVLKLVVDGKSNLEISKILCISEHTAKAHVCNIIQKLVVDDRTQAAVKAIKEGIV